MREDECRTRAEAARIARLGTTGANLRPHIVPVTFALIADQVVMAIDQKPKSTTNLRRLRNIRENSNVCLLWDRYDADWSSLWWVRADGRARAVPEGPEWESAVGALVAKYEQYREDPPRGPAIVVAVAAWSGWTSTAAAGQGAVPLDPSQ